MAVSVEESFAVELRERGVVRVLLQELAEEKRLPRQGLGALVVREEVEEFVAEDGDAAGLEADDGDSGFNFGFELVEDFEQKALGAIEHAEVVEGTAAAEIGLRYRDAEAGGLEDFDGGAGGGGSEVVVESVRPEENGN